MEKPIQQCRGERLIPRKGVVPLAEWQVACQDERAFFVASCDDLKKQICLFAAQRQIANLIDDEQA